MNWLSSIYGGKLTSTLAVKKVNMPFNTIRQLADSNDYVMAIKRGSVREDLFKVIIIIITIMPN